MKSLKLNFLLPLLTLVMFGYSQAQVKPEKHINIEAIGFTVDRIDELETIDWDDLFNLFDDQVADSKISLYVQLKDIDVITQDDTEMSFTNLKYQVSGFVHEKDRLKAQLKGITNRLVTKYRDN